MSKYEKANRSEQNIKIENIISENEQIIWSSKPKKSAFIVNKIITMLPIALIWLLFDGIFIFGIFSSDVPRQMLWFLIIFFAFHLFPVWIWLANVLSSKKTWENTEYALTNKRIIIQSGFVSMNLQTLYYTDIKNVHLRINVIDKLLGVGDIYFNTSNGNMQAFLDIEHASEVYPKLQKIVLDIQTDIEYPNNLRPKGNDGYNTNYNGI